MLSFVFCRYCKCNEQINSLRLKPCLCHRPTHHTLVIAPLELWSGSYTLSALRVLLSSHHVWDNDWDHNQVITVMHTFFQSSKKNLIIFARWFNVSSTRRKGRLYNIEVIRPASANILQNFQRWGGAFCMGFTGESTCNLSSAGGPNLDIIIWRLQTSVSDA